MIWKTQTRIGRSRKDCETSGKVQKAKLQIEIKKRVLDWCSHQVEKYLESSQPLGSIEDLRDSIKKIEDVNTELVGRIKTASGIIEAKKNLEYSRTTIFS